MNTVSKVINHPALAEFAAKLNADTIREQARLIEDQRATIENLQLAETLEAERRSSQIRAVIEVEMASMRESLAKAAKQIASFQRDVKRWRANYDFLLQELRTMHVIVADPDSGTLSTRSLLSLYEEEDLTVQPDTD